jgi:predicted acylesterase/phospholipase RssA
MTTYNLTSRKVEYLNHITYPELSCIDAIRMSCNIPYIFSEFFYKDNEYIDGGLVDNFPLATVPMSRRKIGLFLDTPYTSLGPSGFHKMLEKFYTIIRAPLLERERSKIKVKDSLTTIILLDNSTNPFSFNLKDTEKSELFSFGYTTTRDIIDILTLKS